MKQLLTISAFIFCLPLFAQHGPPTDCVCNGSTSGGKGKFYMGTGPDFHLGFFENDDRKLNLSTLGFRLHAGYNLNKNFAAELIIQKYAFANIDVLEKGSTSTFYSYLDFNFQFVYRFVKRGSRFIPYVKGGYLMNNTLKKKYTTPNITSEENGFSIHGHYIDIGGGTLFILANQFTLFAESHLSMHPTFFQGIYISDVFKLKPQISIGVNYHF